MIRKVREGREVREKLKGLYVQGASSRLALLVIETMVETRVLRRLENGL